MANVSGTEGYADEASRLAKLMESVSFAKLHHEVLHLIPSPPCAVLDIGSGTGRDAAQFAAMGHRVVAVEPVHELRTTAAALHPSQQIEWLDDSLPELASLVARQARFDLIMLTAVAFFHDRTGSPRHPHLPPASSWFVTPCCRPLAGRAGCISTWHSAGRRCRGSQACCGKAA